MLLSEICKQQQKVILDMICQAVNRTKKLLNVKTQKKCTRRLEWKIKGLECWVTLIVDLLEDFGLVSLCPQLSKPLLSLHLYLFLIPHLLSHSNIQLFPSLQNVIKECNKNERVGRLQFILGMNSGFSSVPEKMPKNANAARRAMSHAVHSFMSLYTCTLMAPGGWAYNIRMTPASYEP